MCLMKAKSGPVGTALLRGIGEIGSDRIKAAAPSVSLPADKVSAACTRPAYPGRVIYALRQRSFTTVICHGGHAVRSRRDTTSPPSVEDPIGNSKREPMKMEGDLG